jgi:UDP-glucose:tetrahydrobiopterin glucosyltransferase
MRVLFVSTPISPIGAGDGGGVETMLRELAPALAARGHAVAVVSPAGSSLPDGVPIYQVTGDPPFNATTGFRDAAIAVQPQGVLERMWSQARRIAPSFDVIISLTYDWLSFYLTPFLPVPVLHWVPLAASIEAVDAEIREQHSRLPDHFAFWSQTQASTFSLPEPQARIIPGAVNIDRFPFSALPDPILAWAARISPEKGLEDAVQVARQTSLPLHVCGKIQDQEYWQRICNSVPAGTITYHGLLPDHRLAQILGKAIAMLVTPKWVEAFGLTVIEALSCGTPVVAYAQGGPAEIIEHGKNGFLVAPNDMPAMVDALGKIGTLQRTGARQRAENYSTARLADNMERWISSVLQSSRDSQVSAAGASPGWHAAQ